MEIVSLIIITLVIIVSSMYVALQNRTVTNPLSKCAGYGAVILIIGLVSFMSLVMKPAKNRGAEETRLLIAGKPIEVRAENLINRIFSPCKIFNIGSTVLFYEPNERIYSFEGISYADGLTRKELVSDTPNFVSYIVFDRGGELYLGRNSTNATTALH